MVGPAYWPLSTAHGGKWGFGGSRAQLTTDTLGREHHDDDEHDVEDDEHDDDDDGDEDDNMIMMALTMMLSVEVLTFRKGMIAKKEFQF